MAYRAVYYYDLKSLEYSFCEVLDDSLELPTTKVDAEGHAVGATTVTPADGLATPRKFDVDGQTWIGATAEEHEKRYPTPAVVPTAEQQMVMQQALDINQLKQLTMAQASQIAILSKGSAE